jgi:hypothetical protein
MVSMHIEELPAIIRDDVEDFLETHPRSPAAQLRPKLGVVGNVWLTHVSRKLEQGASGLGQTPRDARKISIGASWNRSFREMVPKRINPRSY